VLSRETNLDQGKRVMGTLKAALAALLVLTATSVAAQDGIGLVKRSKGDVVIQRQGVRVPAVKGTELYRGDHLITSKDGYAYVEMRGAAPLAIGPETDVALDRFVSDEKRVANRSAPRLLQSLASYFALNRQR
jgi:hypothetical protein